MFLVFFDKSGCKRSENQPIIVFGDEDIHLLFEPLKDIGVFFCLNDVIIMNFFDSETLSRGI